MASKGRLAEQSTSTRAALIAAAQELFAAHGFAETTTEQVVRRARVTRGALYHHFTSKEEIFRAVYETIEQEIANTSVRAAMLGTEPLERLRLGLEASLDACLDPHVARIVLFDGVSVLGWDTWHEIGAKYSFLVLTLGLEAAMEVGEIERRPVEPLAHMIQGAVIQAAMMLARSSDPAEARRMVAGEVARLLTGLAVTPPKRKQRPR